GGRHPRALPGPAAPRAGHRPRRLAARLADHRGDPAARGRVPLLGTDLGHRRRHPDLRREALRATVIQRRPHGHRGEPGLRAGGAPAGRQADPGARRDALRLHPAGLALHRGGVWRARGAHGHADHAAPHPVDQLGFIAGILLCLDGVTFVTSRIGMLDIYQVLFVVAAAGALLVDRDRMRARMHHAALAGRVDLSDLGPRLGFRWWRFTAGVMLGLALGVKWSGLYFIAFFGIMTVAWDWALRSRYGVRRPLAGA